MAQVKALGGGEGTRYQQQQETITTPENEEGTEETGEGECAGEAVSQELWSDRDPAGGMASKQSQKRSTLNSCLPPIL